MVAMRIAKFPALSGVGLDPHTVPPGSLPPVPPALVNPAPMPFYPWIVSMSNQGPPLIFGKFTLTGTITEYFTDMLAGHDWGMGQTHIPAPPVVSPAMPLVTMGSSHKYFMPSYAVKETPQGGALAMAGASGSAVAIVDPGFMMVLQDCIQSFVAPLGMGFNAPTVRWIGFGVFDLAAGAISMIGDGLGAAVSGAIGDAAADLTDDVSGAVFGAVLNCAGAAATNYAAANPDAAAAGGVAVAVAAVYSPVTAVLAAPAVIGLGTGMAADFVGEMGHPDP